MTPGTPGSSINLPVITDRGVKDPARCAACGGKCCEAQPGACWPEDFAGDLERIIAGITGGAFAVRCDRGGAPLWVRPATVRGKRLRIVFDRDEVGRCSAWDKTSGCGFRFDERPAQCRWVTHAVYTQCRADGAHQDFAAVEAWAADGLMSRIVARLEALGFRHDQPPTGLPPEELAIAEGRAAVCDGCKLKEGVHRIVSGWPVWRVKCGACGCGGLSLVRDECPRNLWPTFRG